jgi:lipopolysaccharide/colanic/teichoic acid biosynthesis glycosyltransferase
MMTAVRVPTPVAPVHLPTRVRLVPPRPRGSVAWTVVDYSAAAVGAVLVSPVLLAAMLLITLTSRGPAVYTQTRTGRGGRSFTIYKLRTMLHDCESLTGPRWSMPGDPRITPVGAVLRKLHIDELPQLLNVLRGEMSLVGPRPERPEICAELRSIIPGYDDRHAVKPGLTGYAQIHLPPDETVEDVRKKLAYDRVGIRRAGLLFNAGVIFATLLKVFGLKRLYSRAD